jgi:FkbM family methyltransferase
MPFTSYAQNGEDVLLRRVFSLDQPGFYIDVGAAHPVYDSVSKAFSLHGWSGINIEPLSDLHKMLCEDRPRDINLQIGLSDRQGRLPFFEVPSCNGWSTLSAEVAANLAVTGVDVVERSIPVQTLADVCAEHVRQPIDFLKVDVEEHEAQVIAGADWHRWRPRVVVVEATRQNSPTPNHQTWEPRLLAADYLFAFFDGLNRYYVRSEDRAWLPKLAVPANVFDDYVCIRHVQQVEALNSHLTELRGQLQLHQHELQISQSQVKEYEAAARQQQSAIKLLQQANASALDEFAATRAATQSLIHAMQRTLDHAWSCLPYRMVRKARTLVQRARTAARSRAA